MSEHSAHTHVMLQQKQNLISIISKLHVFSENANILNFILNHYVFKMACRSVYSLAQTLTQI